MHAPPAFTEKRNFTIMATRKNRRTSKGKAGTESASLKTLASNAVRDDDNRKYGLRSWLLTITGVCFGIFAVYLFTACVSFFFTAASDQALIEVANSGGDIGEETIHNITGIGGARLADKLVNGGFGVMSLFIPVFLLLVGMKLLNPKEHLRLWSKFLNMGFLMVWGSVAIAFAVPKRTIESMAFSPSGAHGENICSTLLEQVGNVGIICVLAVLMVAYLAYLTPKTITIIRKGSRKVSQAPHLRNKQDTPNGAEDGERTETSEEVEGEPVGEENVVISFEDGEKETEQADKPEKKKTSDTDAAKKTKKTKGGKTKDTSIENPYDPRMDLEYYKFPTLNLLRKYKIEQAVDAAEQNSNKERIKSVLHSFGVEISKVDATVGPTVTLYEITLAEGIRVSKVRGLADDIALSLSALGIRIIAPIPGKGTIGIEVPNKRPQLVPIESVLNSQKFRETKYELPLALGKTITNEVFMVDLAKLPHLLVAGATGQGKSVGLNTIITSLLYKKHPSELKLVLIDPKKVEFSIYSPLIRHFLAKYPEDEDAIVTDVTKVVRVLRSLCQEMEDRYDLLDKANCRNIKEYNSLFMSRQLNPQNGHRFLPYFVIIIDEYGDLIMTAGKDIELPIARIAQKARAVGMHMVIATQRPTANIITGTIKANFPARMAFRVASQVDSRTILDQSGANQLVGKGDMLILASEMTPHRVQCAFVDTKEVIDVTHFIAEQQGYAEAYALPIVAEGDGPITSNGKNRDDNGGGDGRFDPLFEEAALFVISKRSGSTSSLQRRYSIGYNRSGKIMDQLQEFGVVGPAQGSKPREVLMTESEFNAKMSVLKPGYAPQPLDDTDTVAEE